MASLKVAFFTTNDPKNYSGGRYHGLIMACACARAGFETHVVTDHVPAFAGELLHLVPDNKVRFHVVKSFTDPIPSLPALDLSIVVPTGIFYPEFYEGSLEKAAHARSIVGLVNFESANWFNALAPVPRDPRLWDYWRRTLQNGGLCFSSLRESARWAADFYKPAIGHKLRHEIWGPPINSPSAREWDGASKTGDLLIFVRPTDEHKGSNDLIRISPDLFAERTLHLVAGRDLDARFVQTIEDHVRKGRGAVQVHTRINDSAKYGLITRSQAVLFPSRFEGFGLPPVEAAYCGTEVVCFDLPCLVETVGSIAHLAPNGDMAAFSQALSAALKQPERRMALRQTVAAIVDFDLAAENLAEIITRNVAVLDRRAPSGFFAVVGPFYKQQPRPATEFIRDESLTPEPTLITHVQRTTANDIAISGRCYLQKGNVSPTATADFACLSHFERLGEDGEYCCWRFNLLLPATAVGRVVTIGDKTSTSPFDVTIRVDRIETDRPDKKPLLGVSETKPAESGSFVRGWVLAHQNLVSLHVKCENDSWASAPVSVERRDVFQKNVGYPSPIVGFSIVLPSAPAKGPATVILLEGENGIVDAMSSWPPVPESPFQTAAQAPKPDAPKPESPQAMPESEQTIRATIELPIAATSDKEWLNGVARGGGRLRLGAFQLAAEGQAPLLREGAAVAFNSGALRRVTAVKTTGKWVTVTVDGPLDPGRDGAPGHVRVLWEGELKELTTRFSLSGWTDSNWLLSIYNKPGRLFRRCFFVRIDKPWAPKLTVGMLLDFAASGRRLIVETQIDGPNLRVILDAIVQPIGDGTEPISVVAPNTHFESENCLEVASPANGETEPAYWSRTLFLRETAAASKLRLGSALRFSDSTIAAIGSLNRSGSLIEITLDRQIAIPSRTAGSLVTLADPLRLVDGIPFDYVYDGPKFSDPKPLHVALSEEARRRRRCVPSAKASQQRPRVLIVSLVPHEPANQGNRVVTRNLVAHVEKLGFDVDLVVQNWVDPWLSTASFNGRVRVFTLPFPNWATTDSAKLRKSIIESIDAIDLPSLDRGAIAALRSAANRYHPFFPTRTETVDVVRALCQAHDYEALVINYTHLARIAKELEQVTNLPPVAIVTHDALSRLPAQFAGKPLDTGYRACSAEDEAAALDAISGATIVAISRSEVSYFKEIGVKNAIVLTEYDASEEASHYPLPASAFSAKTLVFHGSANPMNIAGMNWFIDLCWDAIKLAVPDARLVVCGRICESWKVERDSISLKGELSRHEMNMILQAASVAINPCVAGTGLKIKTVEAIAMGLPSVFLPHAVDGLEDIAHEVGILARTSEEFISGCVALLSDELAWAGLHRRARQVGQSRFNRDTVYRDLDRAMGWQRGVPSVKVPEPTPLEQPQAPVVAITSEALNDPQAVRLLVEVLLKGGNSDLARVAIETLQPPIESDLLLKKARLELADEKLWQSACSAAAVASANPMSVEAYLIIGQAFCGLKLFEDAKPVLLQAMLIDPGNDESLALLMQAAKATSDEGLLGHIEQRQIERQALLKSAQSQSGSQ